MGDSNGNGQSKLNIDVTNENQFRIDVAQHLQVIADRTACLPALKSKVDTHDKIVTFGKWLAIPSQFVLYWVGSWLKSKISFHG